MYVQDTRRRVQALHQSSPDIRLVVSMLATSLQGALLLRQVDSAPVADRAKYTAVAQAFCSSRMAPDGVLRADYGSIGLLDAKQIIDFSFSMAN